MNLTLRSIYLIVFSLVATFGASAQCIDTVDFTNWTNYGVASQFGSTSPMWVVGTPPTSVQSQENTNFPTFFVSPDTFINVRFSGDIKVNTTSDDDYIGFVMGYQGPFNLVAPYVNSPTLDMDFVVLDWKQYAQTYAGYSAPAGHSLNDVDGTYIHSNASIFPGFWSHTNSATWSVLGSIWGNNLGWTDFVTYHYDIIYTPTRIVVYINNVLKFDVTGCFEPGRIGFYNYSQDAAIYSNFQYELYMDFTIEAQDVCLGDTARFTLADTACYAGNALTNIDTFYWDLGDGTLSSDTNPWHIYATADTFEISLVATDINGCTDSMTKEVYIRELPYASASYTNICLGDSTNFTSQSTVFGDDSLTSWTWDFGDGSPVSTLENPIHLYNASGNYPLTLLVETAYGCADSISTNIEIVQPPTANFSVQSACDGDSVYLTNLSTANQFPIDSYQWDVENNQVPDYTTEHVAHVYSTFNQYAAKLEVFDTYGCVDSVIKIVNVHDIPSPNFDAPGVCLGDEMMLYDSSTVNNAAINSWKWAFNGGLDSAFTQNTSYLFNAPEFHSVYLEVTSDSGCTASITDNIYIYPLPVANFTVGSSCANENAIFNQASTSGYGVIDQWHWDFGNGTSTIANPQYTFGQAGELEVELAIQTNLGCKDTITKTIRVYPVPQTNFGWDASICAGEPLQLEDQSQIQQLTPGGDSVVAWQWVIDGVPQFSNQNPTYLTTSNSTISVALTATSNYGCSATQENTVQIAPLPEANFLVEQACEGLPVSYENASSIDYGLVSDFEWSFGDGSVSTLENPDHVYSTFGTFPVKLKVASHMGCEDSISKFVQVFERPDALFESLDSVYCSPVNLEINNLSSISQGSVSYLWKLNGDYLSSQQNAIVLKSAEEMAPMPMSISLQAKSDKGCVDLYEVKNAFTLLPAPSASFDVLTDTIRLFDDGLVVTNNSEHGVKWHWDFGNGASSTEFEPIYEYPNSGTYLIKLTATNIWNCIDEAVRKVHVDHTATMYAPNSFSPNGDGINDVWKVKGDNEGKQVVIKVFNRWGEVIFTSRNLNEAWDGVSEKSGELVPSDVYGYQIRFYDSIDDVIEINGNVTVLY